MGYYGDEKRRQMVRSILPCVSQARKGVKKDLNKRRRMNRRANNNILNRYSGGTSIEAIDMYEEFGEDFNVYVEMHQGNLNHEDIVQHRRNRDHLNHFIHWAEEITKDMDPWDRFPYVQSILPKGFVGDHAMSHVEDAIGYDPIDRFHRDWRERNARRAAEQRAQRKPFFDALYKAIIDTARDDKRRNKFNEYMLRNCTIHQIKITCNWNEVGAIANYRRERIYSPGSKWPTIPEYYKYVVCKNIRTIRGYHDAQRFIDDLFYRHNDQCVIPRYSHSHTEWLETAVAYFRIEVPEGINLHYCNYVYRKYR